MKKNNLLRYWPVTLVLTGILLMAVLVVSSSPAQALNSDNASAIQATVVPPTVVVPTAVIPQTGGDTIFVDFFSNWVLWAVLGVLLIVLLISLAARPAGPTDTHHHHDHDV